MHVIKFNLADARYTPPATGGFVSTITPMDLAPDKIIGTATGAYLAIFKKHH